MLWIAFAIVHLVVAVLGFVLPNQPMGDVYLVYEPWAAQAMRGDGIVGVDSDWIYPQLALVPMLLANLLEWIAGYEVAWAILVTAVDAVVFHMLVGRGRSRGRATAAWFWLVFALLLGPVGMYRLDAITLALALAGCLWLIGRPWAASVLLAVGTWIKVWPAALLAAAVIAVRRRVPIIAGAVLTSAVVLIAVVAAGGAPHALGFVTGQTGRGLQIEAPVSAHYLWRSALGVPGSSVYYDDEILTFQVAGPEVDTVIAVMTPLLVAGLVAIAALGAVKSWRGASFARLFPPLALCLVLAFIVLNKVGSPQYLVWLVPPLAFALVIDLHRWRRIAVTSLVAAALTFVVYPLTYGGVISSLPVPVAVLTVRNALLAALLVWAIVALVRVPVRARHPLPSAPRTGGSP